MSRREARARRSSAEADAICGAPYGTSSPERNNVRNGYRPQEFDIRTGTLELANHEAAVRVVLPGLAARAPPPRRDRPDHGRGDLLPARGQYPADAEARRDPRITRLSRSQVSTMAEDLDAHVADFRSGPLDVGGPYTFVAADALVLKVRQGGPVGNVHALLATGVNADGHREILRLQMGSAENGAAC